MTVPCQAMTLTSIDGMRDLLTERNDTRILFRCIGIDWLRGLARDGSTGPLAILRNVGQVVPKSFRLLVGTLWTMQKRVMIETDPLRRPDSAA